MSSFDDLLNVKLNFFVVSLDNFRFSAKVVKEALVNRRTVRK